MTFANRDRDLDFDPAVGNFDGTLAAQELGQGCVCHVIALVLRDCLRSDFLLEQLCDAFLEVGCHLRSCNM